MNLEDHPSSYIILVIILILILLAFFVAKGEHRM